MAKQSNGNRSEHVETVIIGGGQAGLAAGYHIGKQGGSFVILEANERVGDSWRNRWDSLRLFTPARYSRLPGLRLPVPQASFPTKDEMGDYLESYASTFAMDVRTGVRVERLHRDGDTYFVTTGTKRFETPNVVVASGAHRTPKVPSFADDLDASIVQLHSTEYRNPSQLRDGGVLIVGLGNSGAEIAKELVRTHQVYVSGKPSGQIPFKHGPTMGRIVFPVIRFMGHHVLTMGTPMGRKVQPKFLKLAAPLIRVKKGHLTKAGAELVGRTAGVRGGAPELEDGRVLDVANVIWCTGFREDWPWIDVPVAFGDNGRPVHDRGVATTSPGLYFMGMVFQYAVSSDVLPGVGRDAEYIAKHIASRGSNGRPRARALAGAGIER